MELQKIARSRLAEAKVLRQRNKHDGAVYLCGYAVEIALKCDGVYPIAWEKAGKTSGGGKFFDTTHLLLYIGGAFLLVTILLNGNDAHGMKSVFGAKHRHGNWEQIDALR